MTLKTAPIHGGIHLIFGLFMGDSDLNDKYDLKQSPYKLTTQLCTPKKSTSSERSLMDSKSDTSKLKCHGKLDTPADCITGYDKE